MRDAMHDLYSDDETGGPYLLPADLADPEPANAEEQRLLADKAAPASVIQAAKVKAFVHALRLARAGQLRGEQAEAFASCYWGALLAKFLGEGPALQYASTHEEFQRGQGWGEAMMDVFNLGYGIRTVFAQAPPGTALDDRGGQDSLLARSLNAAQAAQLNCAGSGPLRRWLESHADTIKPPDSGAQTP